MKLQWGNIGKYFLKEETEMISSTRNSGLDALRIIAMAMVGFYIILVGEELMELQMSLQLILFWPV